MLLADHGCGHRRRQEPVLALQPDARPAQLRDLTTDRPDTTESPFTVDAGRFQVETNLFGYTRSRPDEDGAVTDSYELGTTNIRIGLTSDDGVQPRLAALRRHPHAPGRSRRHLPQLRHRRPRPARQVQPVGQRHIRASRAPPRWGCCRCHASHRPTQRHQPRVRRGRLIVPFAIKLRDKFGLGLNAGVAVHQGATTRPDTTPST